MATYFSSEIQADGLQTLYLMNPNYLGYSDTQQQPANAFFLNSGAGNALNTASISHAPPPQNQHFVGIPLPAVGSASSEDPRRFQSTPAALHGIVPRFQYNLWGTVDQTTTGSHPHIPTAVVATNSGGTADVISQLGFHRSAVSLSPNTQQGLSLSLSSQQPAYGSFPGEHHISGKSPVNMISPASGDPVRGSGGSSSSVSNGISGIESVILGSKYLKAAQRLLDEVVNVEKTIKSDAGESSKDKGKMNREPKVGVVTIDGSSGGESAVKRGVELTTAQRQELQMKKAKLVSMLDEVEQRYRQYHHQMQIVVSSFEQAAGIRSARSYTAVALQTISKQFRCLKDVITAQIKATGKSLGGDDDGSGGKAEGSSSRLKFVDHQLHQQRALQQLGMIQNNAWRPQRGLPERAVSVLRAWLFEHFLHPYPKDSDKHMLAKQTGLTRSQVSNWFINARVRLWKPMVEEMYLEETKTQEQNGSENNMNRIEPNKESKPTDLQENQIDRSNILQSKQERVIIHTASPSEISNSTSSTSPLRASLQPQSGFTLVGYSSEMAGIVQRTPKKPRSSDMPKSPSSILSMEMDTKNGERAEGIAGKYGADRQTRHGCWLTEGTAGGGGHGGGFGTYPIGDMGRFDPELMAARYHGNGVSLTLGLPHCENLSLSNQNIQLGSRLHMGTAPETHYNGINTAPPPHSATGYENINIQNGKRFAAQLLPDFVA